jgi:hypothetical protein
MDVLFRDVISRNRLDVVIKMSNGHTLVNHWLVETVVDWQGNSTDQRGPFFVHGTLENDLKTIFFRPSYMRIRESGSEKFATVYQSETCASEGPGYRYEVRHHRCIIWHGRLILLATRVRAPNYAWGRFTQGGITCMLSKEPKYEIACLPALVI